MQPVKVTRHLLIAALGLCLTPIVFAADSKNKKEDDTPYCITASEALYLHKDWDYIYSGRIKGHHSPDNKRKNIFLYENKAVFRQAGFGVADFSTKITGNLIYGQGNLYPTYAKKIDVVSPVLLSEDDLSIVFFMGKNAMGQEIDRIELKLVEDGCFFTGRGELNQYGKDSITSGLMVIHEASDK